MNQFDHARSNPRNAKPRRMKRPGPRNGRLGNLRATTRDAAVVAAGGGGEIKMSP
jgi:hypothetical protein